MKAYGLPKVLLTAQIAASKSSAAHSPGPGGDIRGFMKNVERKATIRRYWKRVERAEGKRQCVSVI